MAYKVILRPSALADLKANFAYVAERGGVATAIGYDRRIREACRRLADFPDRGTPQDDLSPGLRSVSFRRRATIYYLVTTDGVAIVRILYAGQDPRRAFERG